MNKFWSKLIKVNGCWECFLKPQKGGYVKFGKRMYGECMAHRIAWVLKNGPIPEGIKVLHHCDNPICCNPDHLFLGDAAANALDMRSKGRQRKEERNTQAKLSKILVANIRREYELGVQQKELATKYGISQQQVSNITRHANWV